MTLLDKLFSPGAAFQPAVEYSFHHFRDKNRHQIHLHVVMVNLVPVCIPSAGVGQTNNRYRVLRKEPPPRCRQHYQERKFTKFSAGSKSHRLFARRAAGSGFDVLRQFSYDLNGLAENAILAP